MAISLNKGGNVSLSKSDPGLKKISVGLGWDVRETEGAAFDLDASVFLTGETSKVRSDNDFIFYNNLRSSDGSVEHTGDNLTGEGDGDDEQIIVDLSKVPANVATLVFVVNSFTGQNFSQIENAYCRVVNATNDQEIARYNLSAQGAHNAQVMAKIYRHDGEWKMHALGEIASGRTFQDLMPTMRASL